jgi:pimeloyl-ACP methyl ester carboxylesterase
MIGLVLLGLVGLGIGYSNVKTAVEGRRNPPPGQLVDIGGRRLHLHCEGTGGPTVVLDAGAGAWSFMMGRLHQQLRDSLRVCSYDRAGLGWSDASDAGYDVGSSVADLHALIATSLKAPVILVGHSLGANIAQVYAAEHASDLAGVVLLDPGRHDDMAEDFKGDDSAAMRINSCGWTCAAASGATRLGVTRVAARKAGKKNLTPEEARVYRLGLHRPRTNRTLLGTLHYLPKSAIQTRAARSFGSVPVTIMYSENTRPPTGKETADSVAHWHAATLDSMRVLLQGTTQPRGPIVVPGVTHTTMVLDEKARALIVGEVMRMARSASP